MRIDGRERAIIERAKEFLRADYSIRAIDAVFAFDFDPEWNERGDSIRTRFLGRNAPFNKALEDELKEGVEIEVDSDMLWDAIIFAHPLVFGGSGIEKRAGQFEVLKPRRKRPFSPEHEIVLEDGKYIERVEWDAAVAIPPDGLGINGLEQRLFLAHIAAGDEQAERQWNDSYNRAKEREAGLVTFNNRIRELAQFYELDPKRVRYSILWGETPTIPFDEGEYVVTEWRRGKSNRIKVESWKPQLWMPDETSEPTTEGNFQISRAEILMKPPKPRRRQSMSKSVRIRTWSIYRLHTRGGGKLTLDGAIELWNTRFKSEALDPDKRTNYGHQLDSILGKRQLRDYDKWRRSIGLTDP